MPRKIRTSSAFERDLKRVLKQGKDDAKLKPIIIALFKGETLPEKFKDHALIGEWKNRRECHIESDWLLIYQLKEDEVYLERTGSHAALFGK